MNKKGFTLVELLAVVAILGILVIMAMPNVLGSFNTARQNTFKTNASKLISAAQTDFITDSMANVTQTEFVYSNIGTGKELSLSASGGLTYCIKVNGQGKVTYIDAANNDTYLTASMKNDVGITPENIADANTITTSGVQSGAHTVSCN